VPGPKLGPGRACQCPTCKAYFGAVSTFDSHRVGSYRVSGDRRCLTPTEMADKGWAMDSRGYWRTMGGRFDKVPA